MTVDPASLALAAGSILVAEHVRAETRDGKRKARMRRVIDEKTNELQVITGAETPAQEMLTEVTSGWDSMQRRKLVVDLAFSDPFAPYSLKFDPDDVTDALRPIARQLGESEELVDDIVSVRKRAMRSHRTRSWAKVGAFALLGGAVLATAGWAVAPAIGGAIGAGAGLSGAAATAHGLALLGGGSLAAGGAGMAGGMWMVAGTGAAVGATLAGGSSLAYQLGASEVKAEVIKLQVTFRVAILLTQADIAEATHVIDGLRETCDELKDHLATERELNDDNATRVTSLEEKVKAMSEAIAWMEDQRAEVEGEAAAG